MSDVSLDSVVKLYGTVTAVADASLNIRHGEFVTLLGPSGSGKTTTMRMIAGLERANSGTISIGGRVVSSSGVFIPPYRRKLGMVFQSYAVWPHKTVWRNVAFPLEQQGVERGEMTRRVGEMLELVDLGGYGERYPAQLSGGQQQRVALARALVAEPDVVLFDEPLSNLDAQLRDSMRNLIADIHKRTNITSVYVTHDQSEAMVLSDRVYVMDKGRIVQGGTPHELYFNPKNLFVATFIGQANTLRLTAVDRSRKTVTLACGAEIAVDRFCENKAAQSLVVRPHQVSFAEEGRKNAVPATVKSASFLGDRVRYTLSLRSGEELAMEELPNVPPKAEGERVAALLPSDSCVVI